MRRHGAAGQSVVELALVTPLLLLLLLTCADFSRIFIAQVGITNAARAGAQYGSRYSYDTAGIQQRVLSELGQGSVGNGSNQISSISVQRLAAPSPPGGKRVQVTVTYRFHLFTPLFGAQDKILTSVAGAAVK